MNDLLSTPEPAESAISLSGVLRTLRAYRSAILLAMIAVGIIYSILAITSYLLAPSQRSTSQAFRLEFDGAATGKYPNGIRFSSSEIIATPILLTVYRNNHLDRFTSFDEFSRSIYVLEANSEYDRLAAEYQTRLADARLSTIDRVALEKEWSAKAAAVAKNGFSINYLRLKRTSAVPEEAVRKALVDILAQWANRASLEQQVLKYRMAMLSPDIVNETSWQSSNYLISMSILRSKILRVIANVDDITAIPGSEVLRTKSDKSSLAEIRLRLEELVRFRIDPLIRDIFANGLVQKPADTIRFLESQLAFDMRGLTAVESRADSIKQSLELYSLNQGRREPTRKDTSPTSGPSAETVMPQLSDTFIDRLVTLTNQANDATYRQQLIESLRHQNEIAVPMRLAITYEREVLEAARAARAESDSRTGGAVEKDILATKSEVRILISRLNEIYDLLSANLNPSRELYTVTAPPLTTNRHAKSLASIGLFGILTLLVALPIIVALCLLHAHIRAEEIDEARRLPAGASERPENNN